MPSNFDIDFENRLSKHFSADELVAFLGITVEDIIDRFDDVIEEHEDELRKEID